MASCANRRFGDGHNKLTSATICCVVSLTASSLVRIVAARGGGHFADISRCAAFRRKTEVATLPSYQRVTELVADS